uniref:Uncharacterized protein n=1 Tax=Sphaerodactylus townsendi TaxID=933632 RepID=A0ACB8F1N7_9SAUR
MAGTHAKLEHIFKIVIKTSKKKQQQHIHTQLKAMTDQRIKFQEREDVSKKGEGVTARDIGQWFQRSARKWNDASGNPLPVHGKVTVQVSTAAGTGIFRRVFSFLKVHREQNLAD